MVRYIGFPCVVDFILFPKYFTIYGIYFKYNFVYYNSTVDLASLLSENEHTSCLIHVA